MVIIDAYNVLNVQGVLPAHLAGIDLVGLIALIGRSRHAATNVILVCDGHLSRLENPPDRASASRVRFAGVELLFSGPGREADDLIEALLKHHAGSASLIMVSSDRRLHRAARLAGAQPMRSEVFVRQLARDADRRPRQPFPEFARRTPLDQASLAFWMREFGLGEPQQKQPQEKHEESIPTPPPQNPGAPPPPSPAQPPPELDASLRRLLQESGLSIDPVDLDMQRWLDESDGKSG